jgi:DNA-binding PadR family transcriptional regulator
MSRWNISDRDPVPSPELPALADQQRTESETASRPVDHPVERQERPNDPRAERPTEQRAQHEDRGRTYSLRSSEMEAMIDIGRFRTVDVRDLARFAYSGNEARMRGDLENLRGQGLIEEKTVLRAHKSARKMVTLTEQGHRIVRKASGLPEGQRIYHGFVKPKELDHDADLYKVYQKAAHEIQEKGGKPSRVRLDFELKESINRGKEAARRLTEKDRASHLKALAEENGLTTTGSRIHLPDLQVEYETREGTVERENLELLSQNYREDGIRGKAAAGFKIYARSGETNRIRRALADTGLVQEVLSV